VQQQGQRLQQVPRNLGQWCYSQQC
jgi:hypothetical protein